MQSVIRSLATYTPRFLVERLAEDSLSGYETSEEGVILFADISGFTALTERLAKAGPEGAEQLTRLLNMYFGELVDTVLDAGGDIVKFAGDALIAVWRKPPTVSATEMTRSVAATTISIQKRLVSNPAAIEANLSLKLSIGYGPYRVALLGGMLGRWETVITGAPLAQVGVANHAASPGQIVLSQEAWEVLDLPQSGRPTDDADGFLLEFIDHPERPAPGPLDFPPSIEPKLRACTPAAIRARLDAGLTDWLGETRKVSIMFVNLPGLNSETPLDIGLELLQLVQQSIYQFEGSLNKISVDDKGASIVAVFGLPPLAHPDDPDRAICSSIALREAFEAKESGCSIGVATGVVFCGSMGSARRREYTVLGDTVNLSARLMQAAKGNILCDEATTRGARSVMRTLHLEELPSITLKGKAQPIKIFRPERRSSALSTQHGVRSSVPLLGRAVERARIVEAIDALRAGRGDSLMVSGEAGVGKSRFVEFILESAEEAGLPFLAGSAEVTEQKTPYRAWRPVFREYFGLSPMPGSATAEQERAAVLKKIEPERAPYLNDVLALDILETETTSALSGPFRAAAVRAFLLSILSGSGKPLVIVIEDLHWADSASLALLQEATATLTNALIVSTSRPTHGAFVQQGLLDQFKLPPERQIVLDNLAPDEAVQLVARRVGLKSLAPDVATMIMEMAQGHPFFSEELAYAIRDAGVDLEKGAGAAGTSALKLPDTLKGVITSRIDRLSPDRQLSLKVASVIGRVFPIQTVQEIHPFHDERDRVHLHFEELEYLQLTPMENPAPEASYIFKHPLTQEVTYDLMLFSQRRALHRKAASWYEANDSFGSMQALPIAAYHYARAIDPTHPEPELVERAIAALRAAGDQATHAFANSEAIQYYKEALTNVALLPESTTRDASELTLLLSLGTVLLASTGYSSSEVQETYSRAAELCERMGSDEHRFTALRGLWAFFTARGDYRVAESYARRLLEIAASRNEPALLLEAYRSLGNSLFWVGELTASIDAMERAIDLYRFDRDKELAYRFGQDPDVACKGLEAWPLTITGRLEEASRRSAEAFERAEQVGHPYSLGYAQIHLISTQQMRREIEQALKSSDEAVAFNSARGFPNWLLAALMVKGWAVGLSGDTATGKGLLEGTLATWRGIGCGLAVPYFLTQLAELYLEEGNSTHALEILKDALEVTERQEERWYEPETWRIQARALLASGASSDAVRAAVERGEERARRIGADLFLRALQHDQLLARSRA